jgi:hypothetical protein
MSAKRREKGSVLLNTRYGSYGGRFGRYHDPASNITKPCSVNNLAAQVLISGQILDRLIYCMNSVSSVS